MKHTPVLLQEVIKYLDPRPNQNFIDATVGDGGHALEILKYISPDGKVLGLDWDPTSLQQLELRGTSSISSEEVKGSRLDTGSNAWEYEPPRADSRSGIELRPFDNLRVKPFKDCLESGRLVLKQGNFADIAAIISRSNLDKVNGVLFDLGLRTGQIEGDETGEKGQRGERGFSFMKDGPLDMRFDQTQLLTAKEIVNRWPENKLRDVLKDLGEERNYKRIARAIVGYRKKKNIETTLELVGIIGGPNSVLARVFQALRIAVNNELENIKLGLDGAWWILKPGGRIAAISFHSLEDRIVKNFFKEKERAGVAEILTRKPVTPSDSEIKNNSRSRSAKLRAILKK